MTLPEYMEMDLPEFIERLELEPLELRTTQAMSDIQDQFGRLPKVIIEQQLGMMLVSLSQFIQVMRNQVKDEILVPATWWQHLKGDKFPAWLLKKFPVKYKSIKINDEYAFLPGHEIPDPSKSSLLLLRRSCSVN